MDRNIWLIFIVIICFAMDILSLYMGAINTINSFSLTSFSLGCLIMGWEND